MVFVIENISYNKEWMLPYFYQQASTILIEKQENYQAENCGPTILLINIKAKIFNQTLANESQGIWKEKCSMTKQSLYFEDKSCSMLGEIFIQINLMFT